MQGDENTFIIRSLIPSDASFSYIRLPSRRSRADLSDLSNLGLPAQGCMMAAVERSEQKASDF